MDSIKQWVITISAVSIISGILISVLPKSSNKTLFKSITSIVMIYAFLQPLTNAQKLKINIDAYLSENYEISNNANDYALSSMISSAERAIEILLAEEVNKFKISCDFYCECEVVNNKITVNKIIVKPEQDKETTKKIYNIADSFDINKEVIVFEGDKR